MSIPNKIVLPTVKSEVDKRWISQSILMIGPPKVGKSEFFSLPPVKLAGNDDYFSTIKLIIISELCVSIILNPTSSNAL